MNPFTELLDWLWQHAPGLLVFILIVAAIWLTLKINSFSHRLASTERVCNDINDRQKEMSKAMQEMNTQMNARFSKIELSLNTIMTYLSTKSGKFNIAEKIKTYDRKIQFHRTQKHLII